MAVGVGTADSAVVVVVADVGGGWMSFGCLVLLL